MKKLIVKIKVIDIPYSQAVEAIPATEFEPEIAAIPEALEVSHDEIIAQTQGSDEELAEWLAGDCFKYPAGYWVEYIDLEQDFDYLLAKCHALRTSEYPSLGDQADAAFKSRKGDDSQQLALDALINSIKIKYPKPVA